MKINLPVTNVEFPLTDTDSVVSKTNLRDEITFVNADFVRISGYTESELLGAPHNIIRHPDMPPEIFQDMWSSLQKERPWTGVIKNRCKNGDFYWVFARVTPFYENNTLAGYISVRTKPDASQVSEAVKAYQKFRAGEADKLKIQDGNIVKDTLWAKLAFLNTLSIKSRLSIFSVAILLLSCIAWGGVLYGISMANEGLRTVSEHHMKPTVQMAHIQKLLLTSRLQITANLATPSAEGSLNASSSIEQNISEINKFLTHYKASTHVSEEKIQAEQFVKNIQRYITEGLEPAVAALRSNDVDLINSILINKIRPLYEPLDESIQNLIEIEQNDTQQEYLIAQARYDYILTVLAGMIVFSILLTFWHHLYVACAIVRPLNKVLGYFRQIAQGNYKNIIAIDREDEIGKVMEGLKGMQIKLGFDMDHIKHISDENLRVKIAMDSIGTGVMIADNARNIVYANKAVTDILSRSTADIRKIMPTFAMDNLLGTSIDRFHKVPEQQAQMLATLSDTHKVRMSLGHRCMELTANPMSNVHGLRLGTVVEWRDRTDEAIVESEVDSFVVAAMLGDFGKRFDLEGKEGFFRNLGEDLNQMMCVSEACINEVVCVLDAVSEGDLTKNISNAYQGTMEQLKDDTNRTVENLRDIITQIKIATDSIHTAVQQISLGASDVSTRTETQANSLERAASSVKKMAISVQQNTINARQGNQLTIEATSIAGNGLKVIGSVVATMTDINVASNKIVDIISVIDGIAFQTNILALNAAVEAARAGKEGLGFAVVATEVRSLAQRAALAAGDIKNLIHDSVDKVENGMRLVSQAGLTMEEMVSSIHGVSAIMNQISAASMDQSFGIEQINLIMTQIEEVTQQNSALVKLSAEAASALEEQAESLTATVAGFKLEDTVEAEMISPKANLSINHQAAVKPKLPPIASSNDDWEMF